MIASFLLALFTLLASWFDQPAPEPLPVVVEAPAPVVTQGVSPTTPHYAPPITADSPTCDDPAAIPGQCVQQQLADETLGRAYG